MLADIKSLLSRNLGTKIQSWQNVFLSMPIEHISTLHDLGNVRVITNLAEDLQGLE